MKLCSCVAQVTLWQGSVLRRDVLTVLGTRWVNDTVIKSYLTLLADFSEKQRPDSPSLADVQLLKCSLFYNVLIDSVGEYEFHRARQMFRRDKQLMLRQLLLLPVLFDKNHWVLAVINIQSSRFELYDPAWKKSQARKYEKVLSNLRKWMRDEYSADHRRTNYLPEYYMAIETWESHVPSKTEIPQQTDAYSCGVFIMAYACQLTLGGRVEDLKFAMKHVPAYRKRVSLDVKSQTVSNTIGVQK